MPADSAIDVRVPAATPAPVAVGTLDHFLIERYLLYTTHRDRLIRGQVHHTPYPVQNAEIIELDESLVAAAGTDSARNPPLVHFSAGVDVKIFRPIFSGQILTFR